MKNFFNYISLKLSLTLNEVKTILFILIVFSLGLTVKYFNIHIKEKPKKKYSFAFYDSLSKSLEQEKQNLLEQSKIVEKRVDSEQELSDFSVNNLDTKKKSKIAIQERSININLASLDILTKLPGIGPKTAKKIISLRKDKKGFKNLNELLEVKGIGTHKLESIKNYLYIKN